MSKYLKRVVKRLLRPIDISVGADVNGQRFRMPVVRGQSGGYLNLPEPWMTDLLRRLLALAPGAAFMDVGVNMGQTLVKIKSLNRAIGYIGFEPNPFCVQYVRRVIEENRFPNCDIVPIGLADEAAVVGFFSESAADPAATIIAGLRQAQQFSQRQHVPVFPLDRLPGDLLPEHLRIVKIDVEGAELAAISGMTRFIGRQQPWIVCEVLHADSAEHLAMVAERNHRLMSTLVAAGYSVHRLVKRPEGTSIASLEPVVAFSEGVYSGHVSPQLCDYLFVPARVLDATLRSFNKTPGA